MLLGCIFFFWQLPTKFQKLFIIYRLRKVENTLTALIVLTNISARPAKMPSPFSSSSSLFVSFFETSLTGTFSVSLQWKTASFFFWLFEIPFMSRLHETEWDNLIYCVDIWIQLFYAQAAFHHKCKAFRHNECHSQLLTSNLAKSNQKWIQIHVCIS